MWHLNKYIYIYLYVYILYYIILYFIVLYYIMLIKKGSHKRYVTLTTLVVVWALWFFEIFIWSELYWWALKERNSSCLQSILGVYSIEYTPKII